MHVGEGQGREPLGAALPGGAAKGLFTGRVEAAGAALAGGAELVEPGADVLGGELRELLPTEAGDEVEPGDGGVAGVRVLAELVDGDSVEPVRQIRSHAALRRRDGDTTVAGGDLLRELRQGLPPGGAVDADALAGVAGSEDVSSGFPAAVLALVDSPIAVGADTAGGGGVAGRGHQAASCSSRAWMKSVSAWVGMRRARPRVIEAS